MPVRLPLILSGFTLALSFCLSSFTRTASTVAVHPGAALSKVYCAACHLYAGPELLDRRTWQEHILPRMGYFLGVYPADSLRHSLIETEPSAREAVLEADIFPETPLIDSSDWADIVAYYLETAPERLADPVFPEVDTFLPGFRVRFPKAYLSPPSVTMVRVADAGGLYIGDAHTQSLRYFDRALDQQLQARVREGAVSLLEDPDRLLVTVMGSFSPTDAASGFVLELPRQSGASPVVRIPGLQRPVHTSRSDLNGDGRDDLVISEFGKWTGRLAWWEQLAEGGYTPHILKRRSGAIRTVIRDINADGLPDIYALYGQGDEGIWRYINLGEGRFREEEVLRFPATYGSSFFDLADLDGDGIEEILYTCGDNADYPPFTKAYHGLRIFRQDEQGRYREDRFIPLPGAYAVKAADFDRDGDVDLAAISFFPDFQRHPELGFVYMENQGGASYRFHTFPQVSAGRWIVMDAGDVDGDGDIDLALGSLAFEVVPPDPVLERWVRQGLPFLLLENTSRP